MTDWLDDCVGKWCVFHTKRGRNPIVGKVRRSEIPGLFSIEDVGRETNIVSEYTVTRWGILKDPKHARNADVLWDPKLWAEIHVPGANWPNMHAALNSTRILDYLDQLPSFCETVAQKLKLDRNGFEWWASQADHARVVVDCFGDWRMENIQHYSDAVDAVISLTTPRD